MRRSRRSARSSVEGAELVLDLIGFDDARAGAPSSSSPARERSTRRRSRGRRPERSSRRCERLGVRCELFGGRRARRHRRARRSRATRAARPRIWSGSASELGSSPAVDARVGSSSILPWTPSSFVAQMPVELLAALPELRQLVDARVAALEPLDDRLELALRLLEGRLSSIGRARRRRRRRARRSTSPASTCSRRAHDLVAAVHDRVAALERRDAGSARPAARARVEACRAALEREQRRAAAAARARRAAAARAARPRGARRGAAPSRERSSDAAQLASGRARRGAPPRSASRRARRRRDRRAACPARARRPRRRGRCTPRPRARRARPRTAAGPRSCRRRARARSRRRRGGTGRRSRSRSTAGARGPCTYVSATTTFAGGKRCTMCVSTSRFAAASLPVTSPISRGKRGSGRLRAASNSPSAASLRLSRSSAARCAPSPKRSIVSAFSRSSPRCSYSSGAAEDVHALAVGAARARSASNCPRGICTGRHAPSSGSLSVKKTDAQRCWRRSSVTSPSIHSVGRRFSQVATPRLNARTE